MKKLGIFMLMLAMALILGSTATMYAQTPAYTYGVQAGNQNYTASLGNDFTVNSPIVVTALGSFASGNSAGFAGTITVGIFNTTTTALVVGPLSLSGNTVASAGAYDGNGDWFKPLPTAVVLPPGNYSIVAVGYSTDLNGNSTAPGYTPPAQNTGGGLITFSPNGRYDPVPADTTLTFPTDTAGNPFQFLAGTFLFVPPTPPAVASVYFTTYYSSNVAGAPDATLRIINDGTTNPLYASIYVFDDSEELTQCCSCKVTADGLLAESLKLNLTANPIRGTVNSRGVIKVISSSTEADVTTGFAPNTPTYGLRVWMTDIQGTKVTLSPGNPVVPAVAGPYFATETEAAHSNLSAAEQTMDQNLCMYDHLLSGHPCTCQPEDYDF
jgi:hypothetical protein